MVAAVYLLRLHVGRILRSRGVLPLVLIIPIAASAAEAAVSAVPRAASLAAFAFFAIWASAAQAAADRNSGLGDGIRSTPVPDSAMVAARFGVTVILFLLQSLIHSIASRMH